jgi:hypothetical protein
VQLIDRAPVDDDEAVGLQAMGGVAIALGLLAAGLWATRSIREID